MQQSVIYPMADTPVLSSHRRHRQDKTVLSCLVSVNRIRDKSRLLVTEDLETVLSTVAMR